MSQRRKCRNGWGILLVFGLCIVLPHQGAAVDIHLFAAASTTTVMDEIAALYAAQGGDRIVPSYTSSSILAKQIANGAPADIFISADEKWMDYLADAKAIDVASRRDLLTNRLVLIAPADTKWSLAITQGFDLVGALRGGYLAMGDPDHVPAGIYGRQALTHLGVWDAIERHVARAADVRAALVLVERGEAAAGVVYSTDAAITSKVRVVAVFPEDSHPPITYPMAMTAAPVPQAQRFFAFLSSDAARAVYERFGFGLAAAPRPR